MSKADGVNFELREKMKEETSKIKRRQAEEEAKAAKRAVAQAETVADKASQEKAALDSKVQKAAGAGAAADKEVEKELEMAEEKAAKTVDEAATPPAEMKFRNVNHDKQGHEPLKHVNNLHKKEGNGAGWVTMSESLADEGDKSVDTSYGKKPQIQTVSEGAASTPPSGFMARFKAREDLKHAASDGDAQAIMRAEERLRAAEGVDAPAAAVIAAKEDSDKAAHVVPLAEK